MAPLTYLAVDRNGTELISNQPLKRWKRSKWVDDNFSFDFDTNHITYLPKVLFIG